MYPEELKYTKEHEWARVDGESVVVGVTYFAQDALGDIVYVDLPGPGTEVSAMQPFGEVESTKSVSDIYSPVTGTIVERNAALEDQPELVNTDPYAGGWMVRIQLADPAQLDGLMNASEYRKFLESEADAK